MALDELIVPAGIITGTPMSRRRLLELWDARVRNHAVVSRIALDLANAGLRTEPDFSVGPLDEEIVVLPLDGGSPTPPSDPGELTAGERDGRPGGTARPGASDARRAPQEAPATPGAAADDAGSDPASGHAEETQGEDPVGLLPQTGLRVGAISSAGNGVTSVVPEDSLARTMGIMAERGYSQVPVLDSLGTLQGVISWASIAHMHATGRAPSVVNALTSEYHVVDATAHLLSALPFIQAHGFVLVRSGAGELVGVVTTADLASEFVTIAGPFFTLGEIERRLRRCLGRAFGEDDVRQVHKDRRRRSVDQLMFGEYIRLLDDEVRWKKLNWPGVDRPHFVGLLRHVKDVRNTVMHFNSGSLRDDQLAVLERFVGILRSYDPDRSPW
ncbi:CBS domain-containing protein [Streptomyces sp. NBC_01198]|uniref:CBS domain-containing protein n=1 Tax=Streptomyces sp. NBC_01198 TaxID=2903769 RepID=UPI002E166382|nr:CBS domain-containing protein [Streptomyces sp. NBC_01198]